MQSETKDRDITIYQGEIIDSPELQQFTKRMINTIQLEFEKVVAHRKDPGKYPMSDDPESAENLISAFLDKLPEKTRKLGEEKIFANLQADAQTRENLYGDLAKKVDLASKTSVWQQVKDLPLIKTSSIEDRDNLKYTDKAIPQSEVPQFSLSEFLSPDNFPKSLSKEGEAH